MLLAWLHHHRCRSEVFSQQWMIVGMEFSLRTKWVLPCKDSGYRCFCIHLKIIPEMAGTCSVALRTQLLMDQRVQAYLQSLDLDVAEGQALFQLLQNGHFEKNHGGKGFWSEERTTPIFCGSFQCGGVFWVHGMSSAKVKGWWPMKTSLMAFFGARALHEPLTRPWAAKRKPGRLEKFICNSHIPLIYRIFPIKKKHTTASSCIQQALGHWLDLQKMPPWFAQGFACSVKSSQWPILSGRIRSNESMKEKTSSDIFTHIFPPS